VSPVADGCRNLTSTAVADRLNLTVTIGADSRQLTSATALHEAGGADSASMVKEKIAGVWVQQIVWALRCHMFSAEGPS
jgi:hypothetical protein